MNSTLIFGYGNPSRGDDALGPLLLERLAADGLPDIECLTDFQLQVEHALDLEGRDLVLFIDAHVSCQPPFAFTALLPEGDRSYTTQRISCPYNHRITQFIGCTNGIF